MHDENSIITLTYAPENLPPNGGLVKEDFVGFMKRLRNDVPRIRFFQCGEYGKHGPGHHPHFHAIIFGFKFPDRYYWTTTRAGTRQYRSPLLERKWTAGNSTVGDFTWKGAAYCARYITKKVFGEKAVEHYKDLQPEYVTMSRGGREGKGIGYEWFKEFYGDVFPDDFIVIEGKRYPVPRYYDELYEEMFPGRLEVIKKRRLERARVSEKRYSETNNNKIRREDKREECLAARTRKLERNLEDGTQSF